MPNRKKYPVEDRRKTSHTDYSKVMFCIIVCTVCILAELSILLSLYLFSNRHSVEGEKEKETVEESSQNVVIPTSGVSRILSSSLPSSEKETEASSVEGVATTKVKSTEMESTETEPASSVKESLGVFRVTGYDSCESCCGVWAKYNKTFTGTTPTAGHTVAVDPQVIPLGSIVEINGVSYVAEDTGNFSGKLVDIYFNTHAEAYDYVAQYGDYSEVFIVEE